MSDYPKQVVLVGYRHWGPDPVLPKHRDLVYLFEGCFDPNKPHGFILCIDTPTFVPGLLPGSGLGLWAQRKELFESDILLIRRVHKSLPWFEVLDMEEESEA